MIIQKLLKSFIGFLLAARDGYWSSEGRGAFVTMAPRCPASLSSTVAGPLVPMSGYIPTLSFMCPALLHTLVLASKQFLLSLRAPPAVDHPPPCPPPPRPSPGVLPKAASAVVNILQGHCLLNLFCLFVYTTSFSVMLRSKHSTSK